MSFKLDPKHSYMMPAHFGPRGQDAVPQGSGWYHDVTMMVIPFLTDRETLSAYIPAPYELPEQAIVTVSYACNKQVDWLAGHGYNLIAVNAKVIYKGEETLEGTYSLVIWENLADPILTGRELQGIPKIYADIEEHTVNNGLWHTNASHFGHKIMDLSITDLRNPTAEEIEADAQAKSGKDHPMGWRFVPGIGGYGKGINEFTTFPSETHITEAQVGTGKIVWQSLTWQQNPTQYHIVNALAALPVIAYLPSVVAKGSVNLLVPGQMPRTLG